MFNLDKYFKENACISDSHLKTENGIIFNEDCVGQYGLKNIKDKSVDLILCDLPYATTNNSWDILIDMDILWSEYKRIIKDNGAIVLTAREPFTSMLIMSNIKMFKYKTIWVKSKATNFLNAKKQPLRKYEEILVFYKKQPTYNPQMVEGEPYNKGTRKDQQTGSYNDFRPVEVKSDGMRYPTDVVYFKTAEAEGPVIHSTQKPLGLWEWLLKTYSNEGDIIVDNCSGSLVTGVAATLHNRYFICYEMDKGNYEKGNSRLLGLTLED